MDELFKEVFMRETQLSSVVADEIITYLNDLAARHYALNLVVSKNEYDDYNNCDNHDLRTLMLVWCDIEKKIGSLLKNVPGVKCVLFFMMRHFFPMRLAQV